MRYCCQEGWVVLPALLPNTPEETECEVPPNYLSAAGIGAAEPLHITVQQSWEVTEGTPVAQNKMPLMQSAKHSFAESWFTQIAVWKLLRLPTQCLLPGCADYCLCAHISSITSLFAIKILYAQHCFWPCNLEDQHRAGKQVLGETSLLNFNLLPVKGRIKTDLGRQKSEFIIQLFKSYLSQSQHKHRVSGNNFLQQ